MAINKTRAAKLILPLLGVCLLASCSAISQSQTGVKITSVSEVNWEKLNPARGDMSPQAGTLWGDRKGHGEATGFLAKFKKGFSSPLHIHNVTYRGIVIDGLVHNDDPKAANMWMPQSSYWIQPAGEPHITSAKEETNIAFIEIDSAPYLVRPISKAFDNGEKALNVHNSNVIWQERCNLKVAELWKNKNQELTGSMIKFSGKAGINAPKAKFVVIQGDVKFLGKLLAPGSLIELEHASRLNFVCEKAEECILYQKSI